ncbi:BCCT family transporter [Caballeronia novacaledonica]|uniref:BCCT family transporter n=1 Tax=Caballeronia novacaledonica TaxID=1544861 RepID=UPI001EE15F1C|nr:BCCT family transporter [Caballeronia novacaledonica]GJH13208.1 BCCT family transporter [Caballeronia novacaledonica]
MEIDTTPALAARRDEREVHTRSIDWPIFLISGGFFVLFLVAALCNLSWLSTVVDTAFGWATRVFGFYWQVLMLATFAVSLAIAFSKLGRVKLGGAAQVPSNSTFNWVVIIMCALLAGGGAFWAAAEPLMHFMSPPPFFGAAPRTQAGAVAALAQSFLHWGFLAWAVLGSLLAIVLMHLHFDRGLPLAPRTLLYPLFGARALKGPIATLADATSIIAVAAGTIGPIGFLGLQIAYVLHSVWAVPDTVVTQALVILAVTVIFTSACIAGLEGLRFVCKIHVWLMLGLAAYLYVFGPTAFLTSVFFQAFATHVVDFVQTAMYRGDDKWLNAWTLFYWGWFIGYAPMMAIYVAKVSRGRTIRELVVLLSIAAPVVTMLWFTLVGGAGIGIELASPASVVSHGSLPEALLLGVAQALPLRNLISALFLFLSFFSVVTNGGSMAYTIAMAMSGDRGEPRHWLKIFWAIGMGLVGAVLITMGSGGVSALQSFIVITAVPVSILILPSLWDAVRIARTMAIEQGVDR